MNHIERDAQESSAQTGARRLGRRVFGRVGRRFFAVVLAVAISVGVVTAISAAAVNPSPAHIDFLQCVGGSPTKIDIGAFITGYEEETQWHFEYATSAEGLWTPLPGGSGTISKAEQEHMPEINIQRELTGLESEKTFFVRLEVSNASGGTSEVASCETAPLHPREATVAAQNITATSAVLSGSVIPGDFETHWRFESASSEGGPWTPVAGASDTIVAAEADEAYYQVRGGVLAGLSPSSRYYVRLVAENEHGPTTSEITSFKTFGPPSASAFAVHALHGESPWALGAVNPDSLPTVAEQKIAIEGVPSGGTFTLTYNGHTTASIPYDASYEAVRIALRELPNMPTVTVWGADGGPYVVRLGPPGSAGEATPLIEADALGLTPSGTVTVSNIQSGGEANDAHYRFQYVGQESFAEHGWADAQATTEEDAGVGDSTEFVGADLPGLQAGGVYHFRVRVSSDVPGDPVFYSPEQTLSVPTPATAQAPACPNEALRSGLSAALPDCRAFELVTPAAKGGAQDIFDYGSGVTTFAVGEDGEHTVLKTFAKWGSSPDNFLSQYVFTRQPGGWQMVSATPQPQAGEVTYEPQVFNPDLTETGLLAFTHTKNGPRGHSPDQEYLVGPPGGPYTTVASSPYDQEGEGAQLLAGKWVAASADFSKLILRTGDRVLLSSTPSSTTTGYDLYEWSGGRLRQANVLTGGAPIGTCGASMVNGYEGYRETTFAYSSSNAVSADGSRVFFEAVPGSDCKAPTNLYMRADGSTTLDIGAYTFLAANAEGSELLLGRENGGTHDYYLYNTEAQTARHLFSTDGEINELTVGDDFTAFYFGSPDSLTAEAPQGSAALLDIYRYDISTETLRYIFSSAGTGGTGGDNTVSPDGQYFYFASSEVGGLPGGSGKVVEVYRYDDAEQTVQCMSCASPFDPEPKLSASFLTAGADTELGNEWADGVPQQTISSANGDYVFFDAASELVPQDIDGEIEPVEDNHNSTSSISESSDVYEWRKNGVDGCMHVQGCLALITSVSGGLKNLLLGTTPSGRDVFFATHSALVPQDQDTAGDVYDARIGGGFPPPAPLPVECEGDACSTPASAPVDATPSSLTFSGTGNILEPPVVVVKAKAKGKALRCAKGRTASHGRCVKAKTVKRKVKRGKRSRVTSRKGGGR